jgi:hypothetical protein
MAASVYSLDSAYLTDKTSVDTGYLTVAEDGGMTGLDPCGSSDNWTELIRGEQPARRRLSFRFLAMYVRSGSVPCDGHSVEVELVALDVLHHDARLVVVIGRQ